MAACITLSDNVVMSFIEMMSYCDHCIVLGRYNILLYEAVKCCHKATNDMRWKFESSMIPQNTKIWTESLHLTPKWPKPAAFYHWFIIFNFVWRSKVSYSKILFQKVILSLRVPIFKMWTKYLIFFNHTRRDATDEEGIKESCLLFRKI